MNQVIKMFKQEAEGMILFQAFVEDGNLFSMKWDTD